MRIVKQLERYLFARFHGRLCGLEKSQDKTLILQSKLLTERNRKKDRINSLADVEFSCFSQWGEDGILDWLIERLPGIPNTFVEFGVQDYRESNTRLLLHLRNWHGLVLDGSEEFISDIKRQEISWRYNLVATQAFIDCDNINQLLSSSGVSGPVGLLSVDIDGNDYWVWKAIDSIKPAIVVCEYNAVFGDLHRITVPYRADFQRAKAHVSNLYFGASLPALIDLAQQKGYVFVGSNSNGCNAFFVRKDLHVTLSNAIGEVKAFPSSFRESRAVDGALSYQSGNDRINIIRHLPVFNLQSQSICQLEDLGDLYSNSWL